MAKLIEKISKATISDLLTDIRMHNIQELNNVIHINQPHFRSEMVGASVYEKSGEIILSSTRAKNTYLKIDVSSIVSVDYSRSMKKIMIELKDGSDVHLGVDSDDWDNIQSGDDYL